MRAYRRKAPIGYALANSFSIAGALICVVAGLMAAQRVWLVPVAGIFMIGSLCDAIDGRIARKFARKFQPALWGAFLDTLADKIGELGLLIGLAFRSSDAPTIRMLMAAAVSGLLCSFVKSSAEEKGLRLNWPEVRILGRTTRVTLLTVGLLIIRPPEEHGLWALGITLASWNGLMTLVRVIRIYGAHLRMTDSDHS